MTGLASAVTAPLVTVGAAGATESMTTTRDTDGLTLPAASVSVVETTLAPCACGSSVVPKRSDQVPLAATVPVLVVPPHTTVTVAPASPVPETATPASDSARLTTLSPAIVATVGAVGAVASMATVVLVAALWLPAMSRAIADTAYDCPSTRRPLQLPCTGAWSPVEIRHVPSARAMVSKLTSPALPMFPSRLTSMRKSTRAPASAVPVKVGASALSAALLVKAGGGGARVSWELPPPPPPAPTASPAMARPPMPAPIAFQLLSEAATIGALRGAGPPGFAPP